MYLCVCVWGGVIWASLNVNFMPPRIAVDTCILRPFDWASRICCIVSSRMPLMSTSCSRTGQERRDVTLLSKDEARVLMHTQWYRYQDCLVIYIHIGMQRMDTIPI
jgi:hypothetical protein